MPRALAAALLAAALLPVCAAQAQPHPPGFHGPGPWPMHFDDRYHHNLWYPNVGWSVAAAPVGGISVAFGGGNFLFHGGVWFHPVGPRWVVVTPPVGIIAPMLPPAYTTLWVGGLAYYYANGVYYLPDGPAGYRVVEPPTGVASVQPVAPPPKPAPDPIVYPRNGQSAAQTEADQRACNQWAMTQRDAMSDASIFNRAVQACMDGRGYTLR
ncbi:DUF6515 family protein [Ideonella sp. B508-1]|uniref:DUF6515 family protein n=1 Tax=Ideonella sp. B508-1 TaxID=137716 RepID=UPI000347576F|nr:DUF6515 family protein [Ideonella sp. B508-1]